MEDPSASDLWDKYGEETINLFEDWTHLTIREVKEWQADINRQGGDENRRSSAWLLAYLRNSCTQELRDGIKDAFEALDSFERGCYISVSHYVPYVPDDY